MKFTIQASLKDNIYNLMRGISYHFLGKDEKTGEMNFVHPLNEDGYPRFHLFLRIKQKTNEIIFDLHLDQKRPIYKGVAAHSGEYNGEVVSKEAERIKQVFTFREN